MPPDGNFQDYVSLTQDTLLHKGAMLQVGTTSASTVSYGFSNSAGLLALAAAPTGNGTVFLPTNGGTLLTNVTVSAGTATGALSSVVLSNSNNVSFGLNGSTITATATVASTQGSITVSAGTVTNALASLVFSNAAHGVSFGMNGSTITASMFANISAGATSTNVSAITLSNSNGVSFGINGGTITASVATGLTNIKVSAGASSSNVSAVTFSNGSNVSWGYDGTNITASVASSLTNINVSAGATSNNLSAVTLSNSNNVSFGLNASTVTASYALNVSASGGASPVSAVTFQAGNGFTFGNAAGVITAKYGGFSSWSNGVPVQTYASSDGFISFQPILVPYLLTATALLWLASLSAPANSSGDISISAGVYTLTGGSSGTLSLASSTSSHFSWTSASLSNFSGLQYRSLSISWALTPGPYLFAFCGRSVNAGTWTFVSPQNTLTGGVIGLTLTDPTGSLTTQVAYGVSASSTNAMPATFGIANTTGYVRSGTYNNLLQPWFALQGT